MNSFKNTGRKSYTQGILLLHLEGKQKEKPEVISGPYYISSPRPHKSKTAIICEWYGCFFENTEESKKIS